ncbi:MAG: hypothetical protein WC781_04710 [Candidatus Pacearchaeota archaeon]|jgi:hypothetical protein
MATSQMSSEESEDSQIKKLESLMQLRASQLDRKLKLTNISEYREIIEEEMGQDYDKLAEQRERIYMKDIIYRQLSKRLGELYLGETL